MSFHGLPNPTTAYWTKYTVTHTALQAAALTKDVALASLPAKTVVHAVVLRPTTAFAGTATYTLSVGITGSLEKYVAASDAKAAVTATLFYLPADTFIVTPENFSVAVSLRLSAVATTNNLDQSSAGVVEVYVLTSLLP